jgi:hypothetical protein
MDNTDFFNCKPTAIHTAWPKNAPQKEGRHQGCSPKTLRHRNVFGTTTIKQSSQPAVSSRKASTLHTVVKSRRVSAELPLQKHAIGGNDHLRAAF